MELQNNKKKLPQIRYLLVLDFEATCIENSKLLPCSQIIQFPVMIVDTHQLKIIDKFHQYVKPRFNPELTKFCTQLTGITQQMVDGGKHLQVVLQDFKKWIQSLKFIQEGNFTFLTCGDWDLNNCLRNQAKHKKIKIQSYLKRYINIKKYFVKVLKTPQRSRGMMQMLNILNIPHYGKHHSGIDDVKNICQICIELIKSYNALFLKIQISQSKY